MLRSTWTLALKANRFGAYESLEISSMNNPSFPCACIAVRVLLTARFAELARQVGTWTVMAASWSMAAVALVLMGIMADAALAADARSRRDSKARSKDGRRTQVAQNCVMKVENMHELSRIMANVDAFLALPGGIRT
jgi:hypothetical protein